MQTSKQKIYVGLFILSIFLLNTINWLSRYLFYKVDPNVAEKLVWPSAALVVLMLISLVGVYYEFIHKRK